MEPYAIASCALSVDVGCNACKMRILEVLGSVCGVYDVDIDGDKGLVYVYGVVDPNFLMRALARTGYHAKLKWVNLKHPQAMRSYNNYYEHSHSYGPFSGAISYYNGYYPTRIGSSSYYGPGLLDLPSARSSHACRFRPFAY